MDKYCNYDCQDVQLSLRCLVRYSSVGAKDVHRRQQATDERSANKCQESVMPLLQLRPTVTGRAAWPGRRPLLPPMCAALRHVFRDRSLDSGDDTYASFASQEQQLLPAQAPPAAQAQQPGRQPAAMPVPGGTPTASHPHPPHRHSVPVAHQRHLHTHGHPLHHRKVRGASPRPRGWVGPWEISVRDAHSQGPSPAPAKPCPTHSKPPPIHDPCPPRHPHRARSCQATGGRCIWAPAWPHGVGCATSHSRSWRRAWRARGCSWWRTAGPPTPAGEGLGAGRGWEGWGGAGLR